MLNESKNAIGIILSCMKPILLPKLFVFFYVITNKGHHICYFMSYK